MTSIQAVLSERSHRPAPSGGDDPTDTSAVDFAAMLAGATATVPATDVSSTDVTSTDVSSTDVTFGHTGGRPTGPSDRPDGAGDATRAARVSSGTVAAPVVGSRGGHDRGTDHDTGTGHDTVAAPAGSAPPTADVATSRGPTGRGPAAQGGAASGQANAAPAAPAPRLAPGAARTVGPDPDAGARPAGTQPAGTQPAGTQPGGTQPGGSPSGRAQPEGAEPAGAQPAAAQPAGAQPAGALRAGAASAPSEGAGPGAPSPPAGDLPRRDGPPAVGGVAGWRGRLRDVGAGRGSPAVAATEPKSGTPGAAGPHASPTAVAHALSERPGASGLAGDGGPPGRAAGSDGATRRMPADPGTAVGGSPDALRGAGDRAPSGALPAGPPAAVPGAIAAAPGPAPVAGGGPGAPGATPRPLPAAQQVATVVVPLARGADGSYRLSLRLAPADLGEVRVEVHVEQGTVNLVLSTDSDAVRTLLRGQLDQLRQSFADAGLTSGSFDLTGGGGRPDPQPPAALPAPGGPHPGESQPDGRPGAPPSDGHLPTRRSTTLDLRL